MQTIPMTCPEKKASEIRAALGERQPRSPIIGSSKRAQRDDHEAAYQLLG